MKQFNIKINAVYYRDKTIQGTQPSLFWIGILRDFTNYETIDSNWRFIGGEE